MYNILVVNVVYACDTDQVFFPVMQVGRIYGWTFADIESAYKHNR